MTSSTYSNITNDTTGINYLKDETLVYLPYLVLNCIGIFIGIIGKQYFIIYERQTSRSNI